MTCGTGRPRYAAAPFSANYANCYTMCVQRFIGIDEAGRGALAGPVCVGAVLYPEDFDWREGFQLITKRGEPRLRDSKKIPAQHRDTLFGYITEHGRLKHASALVGNDVIDAIGIVNATNEAAALAISMLEPTPANVKVLLDAGLKAPSKWEQESFIRGDENIPAISFASIIAKVTRDRHMEQLALEYEKYGFEQHKGYGTSVHIANIRKHGTSSIHRTSFMNFLTA
jgi:ribonuclease HII